jgi:predicted O-methyltransferase YrrM
VTEESAARARWRVGGVTEGPVDDYIYALLPERDEVLREMEDVAAKRKIPIVGPAVARLFQQLVLITGAKTVFEMGSAIGYSTIWWARAVGDGGRVYYTDGSKENCEEARRYLERAGVANRVTMKVGDALEILSEHKEPFDLIFNDVDKEDYPRVLRLVTSRLRKGGLFITDNVLWSGRVVPGARGHEDDSTHAILEFNNALYRSPDFFTTILPLRDGLAVAVKI